MRVGRLCARCHNYFAVSLGPNCRLCSPHEIVKQSDEYDELTPVEQLEWMMVNSTSEQVRLDAAEYILKKTQDDE